MRICTPLSLVCLLVCSAAVSAADDIGTPTKDIPELEVLNQYAGTWDVSIADFDGKAVSTSRWILKGRYLQQTGSIEPRDGSEKTELTTLMTYDPDKKMYRTWTFVSNGSTSQGEGTWDATKKVMTTIGRESGSDNTVTITANFAEPDVEKWTIVTTDRSGNTVFEVSGANRRRK